MNKKKAKKEDVEKMMAKLGKIHDCSVNLWRYRTGFGWTVEISEGGTRYKGRTAKSVLRKALKAVRAKA